MRFDPENVERYYLNSDGSVYEHSPKASKEAMGSLISYIQAEDYDQLLEIHLRHVDMIAGLFIRCGEPLSEEKLAGLKNGTWR